MSVYGPAAIAAALQEMSTGPGSMEDRMARALNAASGHVDYDALVEAGLAAQDAMDHAFWDQVGPVFGHDQDAYDRAVANGGASKRWSCWPAPGSRWTFRPLEGMSASRSPRASDAWAAGSVCRYA